MVFVFTLSYGQSQVKYGFSINDDLLAENLIMSDYIKASGRNVYELAIDSTLILSRKTAHSKYTNASVDATKIAKRK